MAADEDDIQRLQGIAVELEQARDANSEASEAIALGNILGDLRILERPPFTIERLRPFERILFYADEAWRYRYHLAMRFIAREMLRLAQPIAAQPIVGTPTSYGSADGASASSNGASHSSNGASQGSAVQDDFLEIDDVEAPAAFKVSLVTWDDFVHKTYAASALGSLAQLGKIVLILGGWPNRLCMIFDILGMLTIACFIVIFAYDLHRVHRSNQCAILLCIVVYGVAEFCLLMLLYKYYAS